VLVVDHVYKAYESPKTYSVLGAFEVCVPLYELAQYLQLDLLCQDIANFLLHLSKGGIGRPLASVPELSPLFNAVNHYHMHQIHVFNPIKPLFVRNPNCDSVMR